MNKIPSTFLLIFLSVAVAALIVGCSGQKSQDLNNAPSQPLNPEQNSVPPTADNRPIIRDNAPAPPINDNQRQGMMGGMQTKAKDACSGKNEGDTCELDTPKGKMTSTCATVQGSLTCKFAFQGGNGNIPQGRGNWSGRSQMTDDQRQAMMAKAKEACSGKADGDTCELDTTRGKMEGTCARVQDALTCRPSFQGGNGPGGPPPAPSPDGT